MFLDHIYKCRTAGGRHLLAFLKCLCPFHCLVSCCHISTGSNLYHIGKANLL